MREPTPPSGESARAHGPDRLERAAGSERVLLCPFEKSWEPRRERTLTRAEHPGTAVEWDGAIFEVRSAEPAEGGGVRYRLAPWPDGHAIRRMERYDPASEESRAADRADRGRRVLGRRLSIALAPLAGLLPGRVQQRMEGELGAPALAMTICSAAPLFAVGVLGLLDRFVAGAGGGLGLPSWLAPPGPIALYLFVESALRLASAAAMLQPMGSLPVVAAWEAWSAWRGEPRPRKSGLPAESAPDRLRMIEPFVALLSAGEQRRIQERYGFDPIRWGKITAASIFLVCASNVLAGALNAVAGRAGGADAAWILLGGPLALEQVARWRRIRSGLPAGSVLAVLVRPLARPLLRG